MILLCEGHRFRYELENICRIFFPYEKITALPGDDPRLIITTRESGTQAARLTVEVRLDGEADSAADTVSNSEPEQEAECERVLAVLLCRILARRCGFFPQWGILTGVRPIKLMRKLTEQGGSQWAQDYFARKLLVSAPKIELSVQTAQAQQQIVSLSAPESFSLYISIPFCPTRCAYCSFVSQSIEKAAKLLPEYVEYLKKEIRHTGALARGLGLRLETVYFGGGTPTTLSAVQLERIMTQIERAFDLSALREYTVEAGRPDTITLEKLKVLNAHGVQRLSINPQTMNDDVLRRIGRNHTAAQVLSAYEMARRLPFQCINMDLIAGLPGDDLASFTRTMEQVLGLAPENVTVHTLAIKRGSRMHEDSAYTFGGDLLGQMLSAAGNMLRGAGYGPYYLYRQKFMLSSAENTGWARQGMDSLYNIYIMEELRSILALGAGAVTKLLAPSGGRIERIFNPKYPREYIEHISTILMHKNDLSAFVKEGG